MASTGDLVSRIYSNFRGADFRGDDVNLLRSPDCLNVWKDYKEIASISTRPGMELVTGFTSPVYGIFFYNDETIVHSGTKLYSIVDGVKSELFTGVAERESSAFIYEEVWYFKDGANYLKYDNSATTPQVESVSGYVPTTSISRKPAGGGTTNEDANMLTGERINTFLADGESFDFYLDAYGIDNDFPPIVKLYDMTIDSGYTVNYSAGCITFTEAPGVPLTEGQDNVSVQFRKTIPGYRDSILKCTMLQVFDNRVFFSGNPDWANTVWHCSLFNPAYCSDLDYYREGMDNAKVNGLVAGNNALWVFREPSDSNTTVFYHVPTIDDTYGKIYPSSHSSIALGCVGKAINFNDDIVFFSDRGMEGISGDITTEQVLGHRSTLVDRKLIAEEDYKNMILEEWEGYLLVIIGDTVFLADSRARFTMENHIEYDWFYWRLEKSITSARVHDGVLYLGTSDGLYSLTDTDAEMESYWVTPKDKFETPQKLKTTNKRGCVVEAVGDISLYAKKDDGEYELIGTYTGITDYFVSRIKQKKFKDLQLKFYSETRFSIETATLECFVGGYIKRA